jgi:hypothetical protein
MRRRILTCAVNAAHCAFSSPFRFAEVNNEIDTPHSVFIHSPVKIIHVMKLMRAPSNGLSIQVVFNEQLHPPKAS